MSSRKIIIAPDSFKGGLSAPEVGKALREGILRADPRAATVLIPLADGGEGTARTLLDAIPGGRMITMEVTGPLPDTAVDAQYAWFERERLAIIEMAAASGLALLKPRQRNPMLTTTYGTGELIAAARNRGASQIILAIGGSATTDGGIGAAAALGWRFTDAQGKNLAPIGGNLRRIAEIIPPPISANPPPAITVLCDVTNPLLGPAGAAAVFGPQKGATPRMVDELEAGLRNLAGKLRPLSQLDPVTQGAGAAGGLGAGAMAFLDATLRSGIQTILGLTRFREALQGADWCVTGEGSFDSQSLRGKVISGVAAIAREEAVPVAVFAGRVRVRPSEYRPAGIQAARAIHAPDMPIEEAIRREATLLRDAAARWWRRTSADRTRR